MFGGCAYRRPHNFPESAMHSNTFSKLISRRQLLSTLGMSVVVAVPLLAHTATILSAWQPASSPRAGLPAKKTVVSF